VSVGTLNVEAAGRFLRTRIKAPYDSGDHLHPSDEGYKAMAAAIDLALFD
jgi:lysophospholipase L1-like esterase